MEVVIRKHKRHRNESSKYETQALMETSKFMFACRLGEVLLRKTDNLSKSLQNKIISAAQGKLIYIRS